MRAHPELTPMSAGVMREYLGAWTAVTEPDPTQIEKFSENYPSANQWLKQALELMLRRFSDIQSSLLHWDHTLLENARKHGPRAVRAIGHAMGENFDDGDLVGEVLVWPA